MATAEANQDPFAAQRSPDEPIFRADENTEAIASNDAEASLSPPVSPNGTRDRRSSREWDASKVPPSQFQKRKGSVYAVPGSRDGHVDNHKSRDKPFHDKLKEKGWFSLGSKK